MGFETTGIDPSEPSLEAGRLHARQNRLTIRYDRGWGEALPYEAGTYDFVFCCDVLEHVTNVAKVMSETARVLKSGGIFFYDTINRNFLSRLVAINMLQKWKRWALMPKNLHCWDKFITPCELQKLLREHHLQWREHRGIRVKGSIPRVISCLRKRVKGELTYKELAGRLLLVESRFKGVMYMGYAVKEDE